MVSSATNVMTEQMRSVQDEVRKKLEKSNGKYKGVVDKHRRQRVFVEGDMIWCFCARKDCLLGLIAS